MESRVGSAINSVGQITTKRKLASAFEREQLSDTLNRTPLLVGPALRSANEFCRHPPRQHQKRDRPPTIRSREMAAQHQEHHGHDQKSVVL